MRCVKCGSANDTIIDTRESTKMRIPTKRRRRKCRDCGHSETWYEFSATSLDAVVNAHAERRARNMLKRLVSEVEKLL